MQTNTSNFKALDRELVAAHPLEDVTLSLSLNLATILPRLVEIEPIALAALTFMPELQLITDDFLRNNNLELSAYQEIAQREQERDPLSRYGINPALYSILSASHSSMFRYADIIRTRAPQDDWSHYYDATQCAQWWAAEKQRNLNLRLTDKITNAQALDQANYHGEVEQAYICPITKEIMTDPVYDSGSGNATRYERVTIEAWIRQGGANPMTREPLSCENLVSDEALASEINDFVVDALRPRSPRIG